MKQRFNWTAALVAATVLPLGAVACGGSKSKPKSTAAVHTTAPMPTANPTAATSSTVTTGPVRATLRGANHTPTAGKSWSYTVHVTDASGKPLAGTVETDFVVPGLGVVGKETPAVHQLKDGVLNDSVTFPAEAVGHPISLVTVVHTPAGSVALAWPVSVSK